MANKTINGLTVTTSAASSDLVPIWVAGSGVTRKITKANFMGGTLTGGGTIATGGNTLTLSGGSPSVTGGGTLALGGYTLTVPATGTAALIANSTWTPSLRFGGADTGLTYAARYGFYYTVDSLVIAFAQIELSNKGSSTGIATVTGLPFASISTANFYIPVFLQAFAITGGFIEGNMSPSSQTINLYSLSSGTRLPLTNAEFTNTSVFQIVVMYQKA